MTIKTVHIADFAKVPHDDIHKITSATDPTLDVMFQNENEIKILERTLNFETFTPVLIVEFRGQKYAYSIQIAQDWKKAKNTS